MALIDPPQSGTIPETEPAPEPRRSELGRRFLTVWAGQTISTIGSALSSVGVVVYVFVSTGSLVWLGLLTAFETLPVLVTSPFLRLTDRYDRRTVMIAADVVAAIGPAIALVVALAGDLRPWHLAVAGFAGGLGSSFQTPAYQAALPGLVDDGAVARANGLVQLGPATAMVLGPAIATPIVAWWGIEVLLAVDLATFAIGVGATLVTRFAGSGPPTADDDGSNRAAIAWLRGPGRPLLGLLIMMAAVNLVLAFFNIAFFALAVDVGGVARAGTAPAVGGASMIAASLVVGKRGIPVRRTRTIAVALAAMGGACIVAAIRPSFVLLVVGAAVALATVPVANAAVSTVFHERVPEAMYGRVFGLRGVIGQMLYPVGVLVAGLVGAHVAAPAMAEGGVLASTVGRVIGVGAERGPALMLVGVAVGLLLLSARLAASRPLASLDRTRAGDAAGELVP